MARILVMGTGGVGGYFGAALDAAGHDVWFVARGANLEAMRSEGLRVTGARGELTVSPAQATEDPAGAGERDLVLLTVKSYDLEEACEAIRPCGGVVLTLQNGVDAAERVRAVIGDVAVAGTTGIVADLAEPGHVDVVSTYARIRFGEPDGAGLSERVRQVAGWLDAGGRIEVDPRPDIRGVLWEKMALICAMAGLTTLCRSPIGPILADRQGRASFRRVLEEVGSVARALGVGVPEDLVEERLRYADGIDPSATSSMYRDFVRGKRLEVDDLHGTIVRLGARTGVAVPVTEAVYVAIRLARPDASGPPEAAVSG